MNVDKIVKVINEGKLVISPTDTVYGIMGDALNDEVIKRVFFVKKSSKTRKNFFVFHKNRHFLRSDNGFVF